ncbi:glucose-6-phosphate dehydrogenase [Polymorphum gilvum]|uniref:Glucose-6-phosphate 1-dehydrogenase n=1 Tax=Polymorphum gilvum (strain LMG 25793 / CGMCC 1.9160 / SL003B-26A1) TaxID=991905 RepID=F2J378_POLGS|nr:glucose-6-phosphate dehydrogenase [Polymorphum gilvum]ADZ69885.1 Glucose-6-phosphate 1-dehydrogenase [Polymorphum gilvum SL003B-26A1]
MAVRVIEVDEFDLVVFGGTGDLAHRKLLPALYHRDLDRQLPAGARIVVTARRRYADADYRDWAAAALGEHVADLDEAALKRFLARIRYVPLDVDAGTGWSELAAVLEERPDVVRVFYLAVAPDFFGPICEGIGGEGLVNATTRVVIEKPIGKDGASARALNATIGAVFDEHQIFRIDHYLGKETVQNLMALRFANALFEPLWNAAHVDHVQITVAESLGVGGRAGYYDAAGALRDMVQNHLLQLLCLAAMEPPESMDADSVRDEKLKVLKALAPITGDSVDRLTVRGQYRAGASAGGAVPGYLEELGRDDSRTETFVALKVQIANWRWAGVPFYLRTGKRLATRVSEIVVQFRPIPHSIFDPEAGPIAANRLILRLQPDEGVTMQVMIKDPGPGGMRLRQVPLDMSFAEAFKVRNPDAYERLLMDVIRGNQTLFMRRDEVDAAWSWIDPILDAWAAGAGHPKPYTSGTWGPSAAIALIERDGRTWAEDGL